MNPLIGITSYYVDNNEFCNSHSRIRGLPGQDMAMCSMEYLEGIREAGGNPVLISPIVDKDYISDMVEYCDGFLFTGGADINPHLYGETPTINCERIIPKRDQFEMELLTKILEVKKPILGICRGMQLINVHFGGTLCQDIQLCSNTMHTHRGTNFPKWYQTHEVSLEEDSELFKAFKLDKLKVNSFHHQMVNRVGEGLKVTARSSEGIIEALEIEGNQFLVAVQWHPEMMFKRIREQMNLFEHFIKNI